MPFLNCRTLASLGSLPIRARVVVEGAMTGLHRARHHGASVEFAEHKLYSPGDELRHVDWRAYGKLDRYYVKQYEQESQLTVFLVLDASGSMEFAGGGLKKLDYAATALAALAYLVIQQQDRVGLRVFGDPAVDALVPPRGKAGHLHDLMSVLDGVIAGGGRGDAPPAPALERIAELARRKRALVVIASDLFDPDDRTLAALRRLRAQRHDVVVLHTLDPHERTLPYEGLTLFEALESDHRLLANPAAIRREYVARMDAFCARVAAECVAGGLDYHLATTDRPIEATLVDVITRRARAGVEAEERAVSFLAPAMLVGLLGVLLPVVIHLIGRRRARIVRFAALDFLMDSRRKTARRLRLRERALFAVRALVCLAIPLALAKPVTSCARTGPQVARGPQAAVLVVDDAFGAGYRLGGTTLLARAVAAADRLLNQLGPEAEVAIVRASEGADNPTELTRDHLRLHDQLADLEPSSRPADLTRALARAAQLLAGSNHARRTVYLLSALPANALRAGEAAWGADGPALEVIDARGDAPLPNRAVTQATVEPDALAGGRGIAVTAEIGNFGADDLVGLTVSLRIDGRVVATGTVDVPAGQRQRKRFLAAMPAGERSADIVVELEPDALPADDRRWLHAQVRDEIRVLMVDGDPRTTRHDDELFYLEAALRPGDRGDSGLRIATVTADDLDAVALDDHDVVVLANVPALPGEQVAALDAWVREGGGLWLAVGDCVDPSAYRATMRPLLPQELADPIDTAWGVAPAERASRALQLVKWEADHPVFAPFTRDAPGLAEARFSRLFLLGPTTDTTDRSVLARFSNGAAALVEARRGEGRLLLWTSSLDRDWNDLPIHPGFLPLAQQVVRHLARTQQRRDGGEVFVGRSLTLPTSEQVRLEVRSDDAPPTVFEGERLTGRASVRYAGAQRPGLYEVFGTDAAGATRRLDELSFAVNLDPRGSDLTPAAVEALPPSGTGSGPVEDAPARRRVELWHAVAAALLLLLLLESLLVLR